MCGITGFFDKDSIFANYHRAAVELMTDTIKHRGPDDVAYFSSEECSIGMRRLAIVDLTPGIYPFLSEDKKIAVTFNGEIYNFPMLKEELYNAGCTFMTNCDGEVILKGYERWGISVVDHLRGMFAISIWDGREKKLILARDRFGIKPLYYIDNKNYFAYASEVKSLFKLDELQNQSGDMSFSLDPTLVSILLGFMYLPESDKTIIKGIKKLEPGCYLEVTKEKTLMTRYWQLQSNMEYDGITYEDAVDTLDTKLTEAVKMHLMSDVPLAVLLSGGLDSSLITAIMTKKLNIPVQTYTARFEHKFNESGLAAETAKYLGTNHHEILIDTNEINRNFEQYADLFDDLTTFDGGIITTKILSHEIRKNGVKVILLGEGADEVFGGYSWYGISQLPFTLLPDYFKNAIYYYLISRNITYKPFTYYSYWNSKTVSPTNTFNDVTLRELFTQLPNHLLMKVDKGTMSESMEARVPYLDHELVEFVYSLPINFRLNGKVFNFGKSNEKRILRDVARRYLPEAVCSRKKRGFLLPMNDVLKSNESKVKQFINDRDSISRELLGQKFTEDLFKHSSIGGINMQREYFKWRLFILEVWSSYYGLKLGS